MQSNTCGDWRGFYTITMNKLRSINTSFWTDPWVENLTPEEKLLFIYLFTNPLTNMLGIYECSFRKASFETGIELKQLERILKGFEGLGKVKLVNNYIILTNYLKHQRFNPNMKKSAIDIYNNLPNELKIKGLVLDRKKPDESFERLSKGYGMVRKVEVEVEVETEYEIEDESECEVMKPSLSQDSDIILNKENYIPKNDETATSYLHNYWNGTMDEKYARWWTTKNEYGYKLKQLGEDEVKAFVERFNNQVVLDNIPFDERKLFARLNNYAMTWLNNSKDKKKKTTITGGYREVGML